MSDISDFLLTQLSLTNLGVHFLFELVAVVSQCAICHSYTPYATVLLLLKNPLSNSQVMKVNLVLVYPVNKCVCGRSIECYSYCLAKE